MENLEAVTEAWNNPGRKPEYHYRIKRQLLKQWPSLYYAVSRLVSSVETTEEQMTITQEQGREVVKAVGRALNPGKKFFSLDVAYTATDAALTALGITVEGEDE